MGVLFYVDKMGVGHTILSREKVETMGGLSCHRSVGGGKLDADRTWLRHQRARDEISPDHTKFRQLRHLTICSEKLLT